VKIRQGDGAWGLLGFGFSGSSRVRSGLEWLASRRSMSFVSKVFTNVMS